MVAIRLRNFYGGLYTTERSVEVPDAYSESEVYGGMRETGAGAFAGANSILAKEIEKTSLKVWQFSFFHRHSSRGR